MGLPKVSRIGASPFWRAGLASLFILGLAGFAAGVIPEACRSGLFACRMKTDPVAADVAAALDVDEIPADEPASSEPSPSAPPTASEDTSPVRIAQAPAPAAREPASITSNDVIARTFEALDLGLVMAPAELSTRRVRVVAVGPDGVPLATDTPPPAAVATAEVAEASAEPSQQPEQAEASPSAEPEPEPRSSVTQVAEVSAEASSEPVSASGYAPVREGSATVTGKGANVRSLPKRGGSDVLFALAGGEEVTVVEMSKGWARVVDARGRSGWIYGDYLRR